MKGWSLSGSISLEEIVLSGPEGMLRKVPSRRRGAVVSEEDRLMVEEVRVAGTSVVSGRSGLLYSLSASGLSAGPERASHRFSSRVAIGSLQESLVNG